MLRSRTILVTLLVALVAARAAAQDDLDGLQRPERLTTGTADQLLGALSPDEKTLYFASNRNTITEIYSQSLAVGTSSLLFDEGADVTWPRVSPDGKQLLYISFREDASGELCIRELPKGAHRCLAESTGAVQAQWVGPARVVVLSRPSADADMRVSMVDVSKALKAHTLFDRNVTSIAASPDGRWLVYTPIERYVARISPGFAARAGRDLVAQRIDHPNDPPANLKLDAPGLTGQAAFSTDGRTLFFIQFVSDSNHDGVIDGNDHGTLFRVPFDVANDDAPAHLSGTTPQQLTDSSWNCQYPSPSAHRVVMTCDRGGHLDAYALPLSGMVPEAWDAARMRIESDVTTGDYELLLLHTHLLGVEKDASRRRSEMVSLLRLHLRLEEFEAAEFYAAHLSAEKDEATKGLGLAVRTLCEHRRALRERERGRLSLDFAPESKKRLAELTNEKTTPTGDAARHIVRSEIADVLGDKTLARSELEATRIEAVSSPGVLELYADRADALYRELDEPEPLIAAYRALATHAALDEREHIGYARSAMRAVVRGRQRTEAEEALKAVKAEPESDLAFSAALSRALLEIVDDHPSAQALEHVTALYKQQHTAPRRRAVIVDAMQRAWERGAQDLMQSLAEVYVKDAEKGTAEHRRASRMYRRLIEDRAYERLGQGKYDAARDDFLAVARNTGSLESWAGYVDRRLRDGGTIEELEAELAHEVPDDKSAVGRYVRAYLVARKLPSLKSPTAEREGDAALALLRGGWSQLKDQPEAVSVLGSLLHERFLHSGDHDAALRATALYLVALDLARSNPRYRAMLLAQLAILQAEVGNWRIAIDDFDQREKLPFVDSTNGLAHRLVKARTLMHLDREEEAGKLADEALEMVDKTPRLAPYLAMVIDRDALFHLAAGQFSRALALYDRLLPLLEQDHSTLGARNRLVARLSHAAAALGAGEPQAALDQIDGVEKLLEVPGIGPALRWPHATEDQTVWTYRVIAAGLRAKALTALGKLDEASAALKARHALYDSQLKKGSVDVLLRELSLTDAQLAELALRRGLGQEALQLSKVAIERLDPVVKRSDKPYDTDQLVTLWQAAEARLATSANVSLRLRQRLASGIDSLAQHGDEKSKDLMRWLEIELGLLGDHAGGSTARSR